MKYLKILKKNSHRQTSIKTETFDSVTFVTIKNKFSWRVPFIERGHDYISFGLKDKELHC